MQSMYVPFTILQKMQAAILDVIRGKSRGLLIYFRSIENLENLLGGIMSGR